ncbi:hypothetical protein AB832_07215 [Flavobacteriaceae bacterium (ex Bugula neritina AB1)]|nr:hypothetical protein AB832_07215 [Flavobacteriaceae bacterium (ex Bugula neritina AB1)]
MNAELEFIKIIINTAKYFKTFNWVWEDIDNRDVNVEKSIEALKNIDRIWIPYLSGVGNIEEVIWVTNIAKMILNYHKDMGRKEAEEYLAHVSIMENIIYKMKY